MCMEGPREQGAVDPIAPPAVGGAGGGVVTECPAYYVRGAHGGCVAACDADLMFDGAEKKFAEVRAFALLKQLFCVAKKLIGKCC